MDRKKLYVGRASSPKYNKTVTVTIILDINNNTVFYNPSNIDESTVEVNYNYETSIKLNLFIYIDKKSSITHY